MMKINIASINKTDVKCLANEFTASHFTNRSLIIICEEGAFHLHSTDGKNTFSQKSSGLKSSQEETDTYVVLYCMYAKRKGYKNVRIRTLDSDVFIYLYYAKTELQGLNVFINIGNSKNR